VKRHLGNVFAFDGPTMDGDLGLTAICVFSKGFLIGSNKGHFALWMKRE